MIPKFRGKSTADENNDEWVYGNLVFDGKRAIIVNGIDEATDEYIAFKDFCSVDIDTVGQSTGSFVMAWCTHRRETNCFSHICTCCKAC